MRNSTVKGDHYNFFSFSGLGEFLPLCLHAGLYWSALRDRNLWMLQLPLSEWGHMSRTGSRLHLWMPGWLYRIQLPGTIIIPSRWLHLFCLRLIYMNHISQSNYLSLIYMNYISQLNCLWLLYINYIKHFSWPLLFLQVDVDPCHPNPCLNGASCFNVQGDYYCHCSDHWEGRHCENTKSTCMSGSCQGKATQLINIYWKFIPRKMGEWVKHIGVIIMYFKSRSISHYISWR